MANVIILWIEFMLVPRLIWVNLFMQINDSTAECKQLKLSVPDPKCNLKLSSVGYTVEGVAMFAGSIMTGRITFVSEQVHHVHNP